VKLYAVRLAATKEAVGFFFDTDERGLRYSVDAVTDTSACEYRHLTKPGAIVWDDPTPLKFHDKNPHLDGDDSENEPTRWLGAEATDGASFNGSLEATTREGKGAWRPLE